MPHWCLLIKLLICRTVALVYYKLQWIKGLARKLSSKSVCPGACHPLRLTPWRMFKELMNGKIKLLAKATPHDRGSKSSSGLLMASQMLVPRWYLITLLDPSISSRQTVMPSAGSTYIGTVTVYRWQRWLSSKSCSIFPCINNDIKGCDGLQAWWLSCTMSHVRIKLSTFITI